MGGFDFSHLQRISYHAYISVSFEPDCAVLVGDQNRAHYREVDWRRLEDMPTEYTMALTADAGEAVAVLHDPAKLLEVAIWLGEMAPILEQKPL